MLSPAGEVLANLDGFEHAIDQRLEAQARIALALVHAIHLPYLSWERLPRPGAFQLVPAPFPGFP